VLLTVWTGPTVLSLCFSLLALCASAVSISWQVYSWRRSGARVKVTASHGFTVGPMPGDDLVFITAVNSGRANTIVRQFGFKLPDKKTLIEFESYLQPVKLPADLAPGGEVSFWYSRARLQAAAAEHKLQASDMRPFVRSGHGEIVGRALKFL
jgi:hypothetical protein